MHGIFNICTVFFTDKRIYSWDFLIRSKTNKTFVPTRAEIAVYIFVYVAFVFILSSQRFCILYTSLAYLHGKRTIYMTFISRFSLREIANSWQLFLFIHKLSFFIAKKCHLVHKSYVQALLLYKLKSVGGMWVDCFVYDHKRIKYLIQ